ncbi:MAG: methylenetetrahydrofolate reductase [NAD(P)H] [Alphaproteobacteria bacterium]|nr:methylenetetrahydrofolate reductase [NAD(P)H] [Alphaproteobacteria bacterium]
MTATFPNPAEGLITGRNVARPPLVSFEFFPPKTEKMAEQLWEAVRRLEPLGPRFVSVTYGAGGSTRERTHATVVRILRETRLTPAAHLTCVSATRQEVDEVAQAYWAAGVRHIVALRGDPPKGVGHFEASLDGYSDSVELIAGLKRIGPFDISAAAYPERHADAPSQQAGIDFLRRKVDAGADRLITQLFFDVENFLRWLDAVRAAGIEVPVVPGIMPVTNFTAAANFCRSSGARVPQWLAQLFEGLDEDPETRKLVGATVAAEQCRRLQAAGINEFHFYTLNRADLTYAISHILGLRARPSALPQSA